ncbi:UbiA family prenyltransferase [Terriglobus albidus]|uniref:UbiA family prenyltransferase n=1 Tax=Terriglobus albidus TaxID=1592106 RepID=UPI0021E0A9C3|nr:UbiA family prenyltransferase [Terriglobus albidus]
MDVPLCVDLDGTLVKSDTLHDALMVMLRQSPASILKTFGWLRQGKAAFKRNVTSVVMLDAAHLPYNHALLQYLREEKANGRKIYLATAAEKALADRVAGHLGIFDGVLASDGKINLAGKNKLAAFQQMFPEGFCYIGNALPDAKLLAACQTPMVANPHGRLKVAMKRSGTVPVRVFDDKKPPLKAFLKAIRIHQWAKNVLIYLPLLLAHQIRWNTVVGATVAFLSFSFCASATYIINDLLDLEVDRRHPRKRLRPFAAADLSVGAGFGIVASFLAISVLLGVALPYLFHAVPGHAWLAQPHKFLLWLAIYAAMTLSYSFRLKRMMLVDVIILSMLYTLRIVVGSVSTGIPVTTWLGAFSIFFFLSLAFAKRFAELENLRAREKDNAAGRGYRVSDLEQLRTFGSASGYAAVVVLALYLNSLTAQNLYPHLTRLWLLIPIIILWISRLWMVASRGDLDEDPVVYALEDRRSLILGGLMLIVVLSAVIPL